MHLNVNVEKMARKGRFDDEKQNRKARGKSKDKPHKNKSHNRDNDMRRFEQLH